MAEVKNLAVLSFAHGHVSSYCAQIAGMQDTRVVAAWDDDVLRGRAAAKQFGLEFVPSLDTLLARSDLDGVIVSSETNKHADLCIAAAKHGLAIALQKPMALSLKDCDRIIAALEEAPVPFTMAYQMRCDPQNQKIKEILDSGMLGNVCVVRRRHAIGALLNPEFGSTWHVSAEANLGMFMDDASHAADFLLWLLGRPRSVMAEIDNVITHVAPDDNGVAIYRWDNGVMGILFNSSTTLAGENTTEIYGDKGVLIQNYGDAPSCNVPRPPGAPGLKWFLAGAKDWEDAGIPSPANHGERIAGVAQPLADFFHGRRGPIATAQDGRICIEMILAAYQSAKTGRRVEFDSPQGGPVPGHAVPPSAYSLSGTRGHRDNTRSRWGAAASQAPASPAAVVDEPSDPEEELAAAMADMPPDTPCYNCGTIVGTLPQCPSCKHTQAEKCHKCATVYVRVLDKCPECGRPHRHARTQRHRQHKRYRVYRKRVLTVAAVVAAILVLAVTVGGLTNLIANGLFHAVR